MELQVTGTNIAVSQRVQDYANKKIGKLAKYWPNILEAKVEIAEEKTKTPDKRIVVRVNIDGDGAGFHGTAHGEDQIKGIDKVFDVMFRQIEDYKGKMVKKGRNVRKEGNAAEKEGTDIEALEEAPEEVETAVPKRAKSTQRRVVKIKRFQIKPASMQEAIEQMEVLKHDFYLFVDCDSDNLKLIYRRKDGNYGLIEPKVE